MTRYLPWLLLAASLAASAQNGAKSVAARALQAEAVQCDSNHESRQACHQNFPAGCSLRKDKHSGKFLPPADDYNPGYDAYLAYFKNQIPKVLPASQGIITAGDLASKHAAAADLGVKGDNHALYSRQLLAMGEGRYFTLIGYLYYKEISSSGEASNCDIQQEDGDDYHIGIGFDPSQSDAARTADQETDKKTRDSDLKPLMKGSVVVEMTPHYRAKYHLAKWTIAKLSAAMGRPVKVVGQLLLDNDHMKRGNICTADGGPEEDNCWRLSAWELHPVTEFYVCPDGATCTEDSGNWVALDDFAPQS